ncbi:MAG TPA: PilZ domain-containing protein [Zoogloea sp.]|uniref:PilZ domain-containing protein n=1 Tax=Zoogloea sp. TaxID=49181 RepID=UPI002C344224|nr:PilZ domain-containing protein [Zoogloea sp.]HMV18172.1 PilZ domain-containing protein [Rhodocyclaceae bacterium]HMV64326.1 PilZ domain-containing protein [Rhodocyclaceae bacterium]HMW52692.1 PilZ domain-containing protein [Rhodocyclaceae bacterium]HMY50430.1 PilZ domain-containing protein [Rhodocyclaceae bacterium]HMZ77070.1 PilZ domain-containing protein [Rhodocyclaceae bacterium]
MNEPTKRATAARPSVLSLNINSKSALYAAYMPFVKNGAIFVPTVRDYKLGDEIFMLLQIMDDSTKHPVAGTVVWVTPPNAQGNKTQGIGVSFAGDEPGQVLRNRIEQILAGHLGSSRPTHTI